MEERKSYMRVKYPFNVSSIWWAVCGVLQWLQFTSHTCPTICSVWEFFNERVYETNETRNVRWQCDDCLNLFTKLFAKQRTYYDNHKTFYFHNVTQFRQKMNTELKIFLGGNWHYPSVFESTESHLVRVTSRFCPNSCDCPQHHATRHFLSRLALFLSHCTG